MRRIAAVALTTSALFLLLVAVLLLRIVIHVDLWRWWVPCVLLAGIVAADFVSGLVHWAADTWGRDTLPVIGPRLLTPFRLHHVNPDDFLQRSFVDANGDVAFVAASALAGLLAVPLDTASGSGLAIAGLSFCGVGMMTNQIHQWAHMAAPPAPIRVLQRCRLILGRAKHAVHHAVPYDAHYCITTGWCNGPLETVDFFRRLERGITLMTGLRPRDDDGRYEQRFGGGL